MLLIIFFIPLCIWTLQLTLFTFFLWGNLRLTWGCFFPVWRLRIFYNSHIHDYYYFSFYFFSLWVFSIILFYFYRRFFNTVFFYNLIVFTLIHIAIWTGIKLSLSSCDPRGDWRSATLCLLLIDNILFTLFHLFDLTDILFFNITIVFLFCLDLWLLKIFLDFIFKCLTSSLSHFD